MKVLFAACALAGCCVALPAANAGVPCSIYDHAEPVNLPELLQTKDGRKISSVADWETRRAELLDYFARNVYGVCPTGRPADLAFTPIEPDREMPEVPAIRRLAKISFSGPRGKWSFNACVFLPKNASADRPVPAFLLICNRGLEKFANFDRTVKSDFFPVEEIVRRGYAAAVFRNTELATDRYLPSLSADGTAILQNPRFTNDVYTCWAPERTRESWGAIAVWAWGSSRVLDWLETMPEVDAKRVAVVGHSRGGKTSLWAGASDSRFAMVCVNDSGCCGAKLNHVAVPMSETIQGDNTWNPHWFADSYRQFDGKDAHLPYDQHWIAALVAPRLLCIASAELDVPSGPWGEFLTARHASPAWELYGKKGLVEGGRPYARGLVLQDGCVGYHLRPGDHDLARFDWNRYMDFADRHMKRSVPVFGEPNYDPGRTAVHNLVAIQEAVDACVSPCVVVEPVPRGRTPDDPARAAWELSARQVYKLCDTNRIFYLELKWCFLEKDKTLKTAFYEADGLRLNAAGRAEYAKRLKPLLDWVAAPSGKCPASSFGYKSDANGTRIHFRRDKRQNFARWWWDRLKTKLGEADALRAKGGELDLLIFGDSLSHRWEYEDSGAPVFAKLTSKYAILNTAIGGDRWEQAYWMAQSGMIDGLKPRYVSILLGANNHNYQWTKDSPETIVEGVSKLMAVVRAKCPNAKFVLYPMLMRLSDDPNTQTNRANDIATCPLLKDLAKRENAHWVEFDQEMRQAIGGSDELKKKYTTDFTHLSTYMFEKWYEALEPILAR